MTKSVIFGFIFILVFAATAVSVETGGAGYTGSGNCQPCHQEIYDVWASSKHAEAFKVEEASRKCNGCHTTLDGKFTIGPFANLDDEQVKFVLTFIKNSGNIQKVGKELNMSYPTVKNRLGKVQEALGFTVSNEDILTMLKNDEISIEEAAKAITKE